MKKHTVLTAVAGLLTLASVAVLPAFAQDTGGTSYNPKPRDEYSRSRGDRDRHGKDTQGQYGYGYDRSGQYGYGQDRHGKDRSKNSGYGSYDYSKKSSGSGSYDYNKKSSGSGYGYGSPTMSR